MGFTEERKLIRDIPVLICKKDDSSVKPMVIFSHGFSGNKESARGYLRELAEMGCYAAALDNRLRGERSGTVIFLTGIKSFGRIDLFLLRKAIKETADDVVLLIDELSQLEDVDRDRITMIGVSMGGFVTYRTTIIDKRIKVAIPIISSPFWDDIPGDVRIVLDKEETTAFSDLTEHQPGKHLDKFFPTSVLMQIGDQDKHFDPKKVMEFHNQLKKFYEKCPESLQLIVYPNTKHELDREMWNKALQWLREKL